DKRQAPEESPDVEANTAETDETPDPAGPTANAVSDNSISGLSLLFRALAAMIKGWFSPGKK
ncbi:MAG: hypothetical protein P8J29_01760, partial [Rhodospirillales bacterium]|nr:hypothetical protein [Rhodospirillales bacterium]